MRDTGNRVVYDKTLLDDVTRKLLPADVRHGFLAVRAIPRPIGMALGLVEFTEPIGAPLTPTEDYLMFALTAPRKSFPYPDAEMSTMDCEALRAVVLGMTKRWHPDLRELLTRCVAEENFYLPVRVSDPISPWPTGPVTLLGDAVHAMSPAGGSGANTALRDAALLAHQLTATRGDRGALIGEYERQMLDYGFAAVRASLA
ncbi:MAG TPA: FAD-dependent monooxygenase [Pseudonocardiaceae bacterium]|nr:FAD-dependent monooxygenase [Pseudonocardiaceae bacterium]